MRAYVEEQRVMVVGGRDDGRRMFWRAVCADPAHGEPIVPVAVPQTWQCLDLRVAWIMARIDAVEHDLAEHPEVLESSAAWPFPEP